MIEMIEFQAHICTHERLVPMEWHPSVGAWVAVGGWLWEGGCVWVGE